LTVYIINEKKFKQYHKVLVDNLKPGKELEKFKELYNRYEDLYEVILTNNRKKLRVFKKSELKADQKCVDHFIKKYSQKYSENKK